MIRNSLVKRVPDICDKVGRKDSIVSPTPWWITALPVTPSPHDHWLAFDHSDDPTPGQRELAILYESCYRP